MAGLRLPPGQRHPDHPGLLSPVFWLDGRVVILDQRRLPHAEIWTAYDTAGDVVRAIREMEVRGAPAIGCAGAFAAALLGATKPAGPELRRGLREIAEARPTAINLAAAIHRMSNAWMMMRDPAAEAQAIWAADLAACRAIGAVGADLLPDEGTVLTHCNAGGLATAGYGTALGVIRAAVERGKRIRVLCDETRPWLQGARLTAWELAQDGIPVEVIVDGAAAHFLQSGAVCAVVVGADRITALGHVANKIGTLGLAASASVFSVPLYVAAPTTSIDSSMTLASAIPIENRAQEEVTTIGDWRITGPGISARNPVFDVTPAHLVTAIVTETGVHRPPFQFSDLGGRPSRSAPPSERP